MSSTTCVVEILTCDKNLTRLEELKARADTQLAANSSEFEDPYPWAFDFCKYTPKGVHFVASTDDLICGWALLGAERFFGLQTMEIGSITTRRKPMGTQRLGRLLHDSIVAYATTNGKDLIFLHAKNPDVAKIYGKWGYLPIFRPEEIAAAEIPAKVSHGDKETEFRNQLGLMMYFPIKSDIVLSNEFKTMISKDAENMTMEGYYGFDRPKEGGGRRKTRRRQKRTRRSPKYNAL